MDIEPGEVKHLELDPRGTVNINAQPWAEVWIDGKKMGETPLANVSIPLGVESSSSIRNSASGKSSPLSSLMRPGRSRSTFPNSRRSRSPESGTQIRLHVCISAFRVPHSVPIRRIRNSRHKIRAHALGRIGIPLDATHFFRNPHTFVQPAAWHLSCPSRLRHFCSVIKVIYVALDYVLRDAGTITVCAATTAGSFPEVHRLRSPVGGLGRARASGPGRAVTLDRS